MKFTDTASTIRSLIIHFQDVTELHRQDNCRGNIDTLLGEITQTELINIFKKKENTAPDPDEIPYIAFQRGPAILHKLLTA